MKGDKLKSGKASQGFTLVELLITMAISGMIVGALYSAYTMQQRTYLAQEQVAEMQQNLRAALVLMSMDIRMAGYDRAQTGLYGITTAESGKFVFTADLNDDSGAPGSGETLTYELYASGTVRALRRIAGQGAVADNIEAIEFRYLDSSGADLGDASGTVSAGLLDNISSIQISILARAGKRDPKFINTKIYTTASGSTMLTMDVHFRRRQQITTIKLRNKGI